MLSKSRIAAIRALRDRDGRQSEKAFLVEAPKNVAELLGSSLAVREVFATERWLEANAPLCARRGVPVTRVSEAELARLSVLVTPSDVLAVASIPHPAVVVSGMKVRDLCLGLDDIRDPGNMGSILRTAEWFGIREIFCSTESVDVYNPKVVQAAMGSLFRVTVRYASLPELLRLLSSGNAGLPIYGACLDGDDLYEQIAPQAGIVVFGNESHGVSPAVEQLLTAKVRIPGPITRDPEGGAPQSLNVGVAVGIVLAELRRQQH